jgi:NAD(P)-dependent dehydrogenase (short-subunit alcohol dehydrogenase family)
VGEVVNLTSDVAYRPPRGPAGDGGAGVAYAASKGALHRVAPQLAKELEGSGVAIFNVDPGFTTVERTVMESKRFGFDLAAGGSPEVVAEAVTWLATAHEALGMTGTCIEA